MSIGNVGQMAIDMLLFNLKDKFYKFSDVYDNAVLPVVGKDHSGNLCQSLEGEIRVMHLLCIFHIFS